jgi:hypothetical protein
MVGVRRQGMPRLDDDQSYLSYYFSNLVIQFPLTYYCAVIDEAFMKVQRQGRKD